MTPSIRFLKTKFLILIMIKTLQIREVGKIKEIKKSIAKIVGLNRCMIGQLLDITPNVKGLVMGFVEGEIIVFLLGNIEDAKVGQAVHSDMQPFTIPVRRVS